MRVLRQAIGISMDEFGGPGRLDLVTIHRIEKGKRMPGGDTLALLVDCFDYHGVTVTLDWLLGRPAPVPTYCGRRLDTSLALNILLEHTSD